MLAPPRQDTGDGRLEPTEDAPVAAGGAVEINGVIDTSGNHRQPFAGSTASARICAPVDSATRRRLGIRGMLLAH